MHIVQLCISVYFVKITVYSKYLILPYLAPRKVCSASKNALNNFVSVNTREIGKKKYEKWLKEKHYLERMFCQGVLSPAEPQEHCRREWLHEQKHFSTNIPESGMIMKKGPLLLDQ